MSPPLLRGDATLPPEDEIARLVEDTALHAHNNNDLFHRLRQLIGEDPEELLEMAGLGVKAQASAIRLAHFAILAAIETLAAQPVQRDEHSWEAARVAVDFHFRRGPEEEGNNTEDERPWPASQETTEGARARHESDSDEDDLEVGNSFSEI